jgi:hypothetical protein
LCVDGLNPRECGIRVIKNFRGDEGCGSLHVVIVTLQTPRPSLCKAPSSASLSAKLRLNPRSPNTASGRTV